jgi:hypothetical protein
MTATIGNEMFDMFTERRENLNINLDLSNIRSNAQLRDYMIGQYGEKLTEAIMAHWHSPKTIEHKPQLEAHSDALKGDSETLDTELEANNQGLDEAEIWNVRPRPSKPAS